ncbi:YajG family lipoprotein [Aliikangiella sp. G2MR2-5]|uniref:YajG family lipoprotein n=1 Tax=Aliikangiella sp. G2MR2-5 TaxID=2788943 RepID=UPI0018AC46A1|nr:YajG family lipoprotein [Aliikangiella sp. G2MR2-5]
MMKKTYRLFFVLTAAISLLSCTTGQLAYRIDPEIKSMSKLSEHTPIVAVQVRDKRESTYYTGEEYAKGPGNESEQLKQNIISQLQKQGFKLITDPLLADLSLTFEIEQLSAKVSKDLFKARIDVDSHIRLKAKRKGTPLEKLFKSNRFQEVAIPVNSNDVTGLINQVLSTQLTAIFDDRELQALAQKSQEENTQTFTIEPVR